MYDSSVLFEFEVRIDGDIQISRTSNSAHWRDDRQEIFAVTQSQITFNPPRRSVGLKLLLVFALAFLMTIPALLFWAIVIDRANRADRVVAEISDLVGGPQQFAGPILAIPYTVGAAANAEGQPTGPALSGTYIVFPKRGDANAQVTTGVRERGMYSAPVWTANLSLRSEFDLSDVGGQLPSGAQLDWSRAEILVGASDARGAQAPITLAMGGRTVSMTPALSLPQTTLYEYQRENPPPVGSEQMRFFGVAAGESAQPGATFTASANLRFAGAQRLSVLAWAEDTTFHATGDWPDPSYDGGYPPIYHNDMAGPPAEGYSGEEDDETGPKGAFRADWSVPFVARNVGGEGTSDVLERLGATSMGVTFVEVANPYQAVSRSFKYAPLFIGLVFLTYFIFETLQKRRVHPAQYVLIGMAQVIFYLLLLSIAERAGFDLGFGIAAVATVALISAYAGWVFKSRRQGFVALAAFSVLYALIYVLMRLEDWALMVGSVISFIAIAAAMYFTRNVDWYGEGAAPENAAVREPNSSPTPGL
jgi:inner membrane protein